MQNSSTKDLFTKFQDHINGEQDLREIIRNIIKEIDAVAKEIATTLQIIHSDIKEISNGCAEARLLFAQCKEHYSKLAAVIPIGQYYRYNSHWQFLTQKIVFFVALTVYLETETMVTRETVAAILGLKESQHDGFHLDIEDYLMGLLQMASELSRFATNAVTQGDYERPLKISKFVSTLNSGFRLLNLKNDGLRKRYDTLKYDVKKIEEVVYDVSIRGLTSPAIIGGGGEAAPALEVVANN